MSPFLRGKYCRYLSISTVANTTTILLLFEKSLLDITYFMTWSKISPWQSRRPKEHSATADSEDAAPPPAAAGLLRPRQLPRRRGEQPQVLPVRGGEGGQEGDAARHPGELWLVRTRWSRDRRPRLWLVQDWDEDAATTEAAAEETTMEGDYADTTTILTMKALGGNKLMVSSGADVKRSNSSKKMSVGKKPIIYLYDNCVM